MRGTLSVADRHRRHGEILQERLGRDLGGREARTRLYGSRLVAYCGDHPFFSVDDWFIGPTPMGAGVPEAINKLSVTFRYNDLESVRALLRNIPASIACFMLEAARTDDPQDDFLHELRRCAHANGALFILDEMITGFRWHDRGAQHFTTSSRTCRTFGKALGNGFSVSALAGQREYMRLGGLDHHRQAARVPALHHPWRRDACAWRRPWRRCEIYDEEPVIERLRAAGDRLRAGFEQAIARHGLGDHVSSAAARPACSTAPRHGRPAEPGVPLAVPAGDDPPRRHRAVAAGQLLA